MGTMLNISNKEETKPEIISLYKKLISAIELEILNEDDPAIQEVYKTCLVQEREKLEAVESDDYKKMIKLKCVTPDWLKEGAQHV